MNLSTGKWTGRSVKRYGLAWPVTVANIENTMAPTDSPLKAGHLEMQHTALQGLTVSAEPQGTPLSSYSNCPK